MGHFAPVTKATSRNRARVTMGGTNTTRTTTIKQV